MRQAWRIHRRFVAKSTSQTRWDQGYQRLLRMTQGAGGIPSPVPPREVSDADRLVGARLAPPASASPKPSSSSSPVCAATSRSAGTAWMSATYCAMLATAGRP